MFNRLVQCAVIVLALGGVSNAAVVTSFGSFTTKPAEFNSVVEGAGGSVTVDPWTSIPLQFDKVDRGDYVVTPNSGGNFRSLLPPSTNSSDNWMVPISPRIDGGVGGRNPRAHPSDYEIGGATFTFNNPVNAIGFDVDDWGTCCFEPTTDLFVSFDGGAPILVASADDLDDGLFDGRYYMFFSAIDDSGTFTKVSFWGNGLDEALLIGGEVRYATIPVGGLSGGSGSSTVVPLPAAIYLLGTGLAIMGFANHRRAKRSAV